MDLKDISEIVKLMDQYGLTSFQLEQEGVSLKLKKGAEISELRDLLSALPQSLPAQYPILSTSNEVAKKASSPQSTSPAEPKIQGEEISSPMVGTFYSRPSPEAAQFCKIGDSVSVGQVICIIEAMKVMNEIKAEKAGIISAILVEDGTPVQYGDPLFRIN